MMRNLIDLCRDERGTSVVELALIAPLMATFLIGTVDISRGFSAKLQLEQVAQQGVEKAMQGMQGNDSTVIFQSLQSEIAASAGVTTPNVEIRYWLECNGVSQNTNPATMAADYERVCAGGQLYSRHLNVKITKTYTPMFSTRWAGAEANGTYTLVGEAGLRVQ